MMAECCVCLENYALVLNIWYHINSFLMTTAVAHIRNVSSKYIKERKVREL